MDSIVGSLLNVPFGEAFMAASSFLQFPKSSQPQSRMRFHSRSVSRGLGHLNLFSMGVFVAGSDMHFNHSSAAIILHEFKKRGRSLRRRILQDRSSFFGQATCGHERWQLSILSLGTWFLLFEELGGNHNGHDESKVAMSSLGSTPILSKPKGRFWTNVLIGLNVLIFLAQEASNGKLLLLGAKVNNMIDQGQIWRFITPAFLHANLAHLLANCYSLNSLGPVIEAQGGPRRFIAVYFGSAITGFVMSYVFTRAPAVGASGAVFGLMGSLAVFFLRHKHLLSGAKQSFSQLARVIAINLVLGLAVNNIDNWGHLGGLIGGAAITWLLGPALTFKQIPGERKMVLVDQPPISRLLPKPRGIHP